MSKNILNINDVFVDIHGNLCVYYIDEGETADDWKSLRTAIVKSINDTGRFVCVSEDGETMAL